MQKKRQTASKKAVVAPPPRLEQLWLFRCIEWASRDAEQAKGMRKQLQSALHEALAATVSSTLARVEQTLRTEWTHQAAMQQLEPTRVPIVHALQQRLSQTLSANNKTRTIALKQVSAEDARAWMSRRLLHALASGDLTQHQHQHHHHQRRELVVRRRLAGPRGIEEAARTAAAALLQPALHMGLPLDKAQDIFQQITRACNALASDVTQACLPSGGKDDEHKHSKPPEPATGTAPGATGSTQITQTTQETKTDAVPAPTQAQAQATTTTPKDNDKNHKAKAGQTFVVEMRQQMEANGAWRAVAGSSVGASMPPSLNALAWRLPDVLVLSILRFLSLADSHLLAQVSRHCLDLVTCAAPRWLCRIDMGNSEQVQRLAAAYKYAFKAQRGLHLPLSQLVVNLAQIRLADLSRWHSQRHRAALASVRRLRLALFYSDLEKMTRLLQLLSRIDHLEFSYSSFLCRMPWFQLHQRQLRTLHMHVNSDAVTHPYALHTCICTDKALSSTTPIAVRISVRLDRSTQMEVVEKWMRTFVPFLAQHVRMASCEIDGVDLSANFIQQVVHTQCVSL